MKNRKTIAGIAGIVCVVMIAIIIAVILNLKFKPDQDSNQDNNLDNNQNISLDSGQDLHSVPESGEFPELFEIPEISENQENLKNPEIPEFSQIPLDLPEIQQQDALMIVEAELADYSDNLTVQNSRENFSGSGYVSALRDGDTIRAGFMIPSPQHYDLTVCVCMDDADAGNPVTNALLLNQEIVGEFTVTEPANFVRVTFPGVYLPAGQVELSLRIMDGGICPDYFEISGNTELSALNYQKQDGLSDSGASPNAQKLMQFLKQNYGNYTLSGQYVSDPENTELEQIYTLTGHYPAIRFSDINFKNSENSWENIRACQDWAQRGGIVGLSWDWDDPGFALTDAVPSGSIDEDGTSIRYQTDVAMLTDAEITQKLQSGAMTSACAQILCEIDDTAELLKPLAEQDVPILWRPLPEAGGGWYWWGESGAEAYRWLWDVVRRRLTDYHKLHNLIWIWNGQNVQYLVNPAQYDIASLDIYLESGQDFQSRHEQFLALYHMTKGKKLLALSECGSLPDVNMMHRDHTIWSFTGLWYDEYLSQYLDPDSDLDSELIHYYNSEKVLTLDEINS